MNHMRSLELKTAHYVIEGVKFRNIAEVTRAARAHGFDGTEGGMRARLEAAGPLTWARLARPVDPGRVAGAKSARHAGAADVAAAIAATEARRAEIAAAVTETEEA